MKKNLSARRRGVLTFEWMLVAIVLVVGVIGGLATMRYAMLAEAGDTVNAIDNINVDFVKTNP